ncbi:MAG: 16S rRNA (guanine(527)-N(7))-methyltransferase RsmG [Deltaproteobacteria bacterium]|nr:16S rRNA (guanine(527)-N(7))-methyltransferase RsmG [Deltaproteobacteria bacterium]
MTQTSQAPSEENREKLRKYAELLLKWSTVVDLTAAKTVQEISQNHIADAYLALEELPESEAIIDIGTGAGLPGIVFAVFRPDTQIHLVDTRIKIGSFLEQVRMELMLSNVHIHITNIEHFKPEDHGLMPGDYYSVSRAFSPMEKLAAYTRHMVSVRSPLYVMSTENSIAANPKQWALNGLELLKGIPYQLGNSQRVIFQVVSP